MRCVCWGLCGCVSCSSVALAFRFGLPCALALCAAAVLAAVLCATPVLDVLPTEVHEPIASVRHGVRRFDADACCAAGQRCHARGALNYLHRHRCVYRWRWGWNGGQRGHAVCKRWESAAGQRFPHSIAADAVCPAGLSAVGRFARLVHALPSLPVVLYAFQAVTGFKLPATGRLHIRLPDLARIGGGIVSLSASLSRRSSWPGPSLPGRCRLRFASLRRWRAR